MPTQPPDNPTAVRPLVQAVLLLVSSLTVMSGATIAPALPLIRQHFAAEPDAEFYAKLLLTVPALLIALTSPLAGVLADRFGRKRLLLGSLVLYALAGGWGIVANTLVSLLLGRALLGVAVAGLMITGGALVADYFVGPARQRFLGVQGGAMALGGVVFISLGGYLATLSWRGPFFVYLAALLLVPLVAQTIQEPPATRRVVDGAAARAGIFTPTILALYGVIFAAMLLFYMVPVQVPFLLARFPGTTSTTTGLVIAGATLAAALSSFNFTRMRRRWDVGALYAGSFLLMALGYGLVAGAQSVAGVALGLVVGGLGNGLMMPNTSASLMDASPEAARGRVLGGMSTAIFLGQFLSPVATKPVADAVGLAAAFGYGAVLLAGLAVSAALLRRRFAGKPDTALRSA